MWHSLSWLDLYCQQGWALEAAQFSQVSWSVSHVKLTLVWLFTHSKVNSELQIFLPIQLDVSALPELFESEGSMEEMGGNGEWIEMAGCIWLTGHSLAISGLMYSYKAITAVLVPLLKMLKFSPLLRRSLQGLLQMDAHPFQICCLGREHVELHRSTSCLIPQNRKAKRK